MPLTTFDSMGTAGSLAMRGAPYGTYGVAKKKKPMTAKVQKMPKKKYPSTFNTGSKTGAAAMVKGAGQALSKKPKGKNPFYHKTY